MSIKYSFASPQEGSASLHPLTSLRAPEESFRGLFSREPKNTTEKTATAVPVAYETKTQMEVDSLSRAIRRVESGILPNASGSEGVSPLNADARQLLIELLRHQINARPTVPAEKERLPIFIAADKEWRQENHRVRTKVGMVGRTMAPLAVLRGRTDLPSPFEMAVQGAASLAEDSVIKVFNDDGDKINQLEKKLKAIQAVNERVAKNAESGLADASNFTEADCKAILTRLKGDYEKIAGK